MERGVQGRAPGRRRDRHQVRPKVDDQNQGAPGERAAGGREQSAPPEDRPHRPLPAPPA